jgi:hypothetical protein
MSLLGSGLQGQVDGGHRGDDEEGDVVALSEHSGLVRSDLGVRVEGWRSGGAHLVGSVTVGDNSVGTDDDTVDIVVLEQTAEHRVAWSQLILESEICEVAHRSWCWVFEASSTRAKSAENLMSAMETMVDPPWWYGAVWA